MNHVELLGSIIKNELKYTPNGTAILELTVGGRQDGRAYYQRTTLFNKIAEIFAEAPVGMPIYLTGRLQQDRWQTKEGQTRSAIKTIVDQIRALDGVTTMEDDRGQAIVEHGRNRVLMAGNTTRDAETKELQKGNVVVTSVALNSKRKGEERTDYIDVSSFNHTSGQGGIRSARKGDGLIVQGVLSTRSWETDDGSRRYKTEVVADSVMLTTRVEDAQPTAPVNAQVEEEFPPESDLPF